MGGNQSPIVCCTDFSLPSVRAGESAAALARLLGRPLELVHVLGVSAGPGGHWPVRDGALVAALREDAGQSIRRQAAELEESGVRVETHLLPGFGDQAIVDYAEERNPFLIVVGTHGRKGAARFFLGSVAERVTRRAPCPVLVVPEAPAGRLREIRPGARLLRLVVGVDGTEATDSALGWIRSLRAETPCDLTFVHLYEPPHEHARSSQLRRRVGEIPGKGRVEMRVRPFPGGELNPLIWEAELDEADLLVLGSGQGRHSNAVSTLRASAIPVVCVPRSAGARRERPAPVRQPRVHRIARGSP